MLLLAMEECGNNLLKDGLCFFCSLELIIPEIYDLESDDIFRNLYPVIRWLLTSCYWFSCYYRFSDIAINSVNPSFI
jgi:hypothetical protein